MVGRSTHLDVVDLMFPIGSSRLYPVFDSKQVARTFTEADMILFSTGEKIVRTSKGLDYKLVNAMAKSANRSVLKNVPEDARVDMHGDILIRHLTYQLKEPNCGASGASLG